MTGFTRRGATDSGSHRRMRGRWGMGAALLACAALLAACTGSAAASGPASGTASGSAPSTASTSAAVSPASSDTTGATCNTPAPQVLEEVEPSVVTVRTPIGLGSGIVFKPNVILTDQHVVARHEGQPANFPTVKITLADGSTTTGTVIGGDVADDVAVIRTKRTHLPPLKFDTTLPEQGQTVLAVGSPLGLANTATRGIVSALGRDLPAGSGGTPLVNLIQTDAAISPGNSGGALVNLCGQVVGVNEAYIPPKAGAVSIGFATPAGVAVDAAKQLLTTGTVTHPVIGVAGRTLTPQIRKALGVHAGHGFVVLQVATGGPAAKAGIQPGDIITTFDGHRIDGYADLLGAVRDTKPGQSVPVTIAQGGTTNKLTLTVGSRGSP